MICLNEPNTYYKQLNILLAFYNNFNKGFDDVIAYFKSKDKNVGTPIGTPMPVNEFVILCNKLKEKYNIDPLENMGFGNFKYILDNLNKKDSDIKYYKQMLDICRIKNY